MPSRPTNPKGFPPVRVPCSGCSRFCQGCDGVAGSEQWVDPDADTHPIDLPRTDKADKPVRKGRFG